MPRGGARPGAGRPKGGKKDAGGQQIATRPPAADAAKEGEILHGDVLMPRPKFEGARDFGVWALNAPDADVSMDQKLRAMQTLAMIEMKQPDGQSKQQQKEAGIQSAMSGRFAPRQVKGFGVVDGGK